jgi:hypothetical protein
MLRLRQRTSLAPRHVLQSKLALPSSPAGSRRVQRSLVQPRPALGPWPSSPRFPNPGAAKTAQCVARHNVPPARWSRRCHEADGPTRSEILDLLRPTAKCGQRPMMSHGATWRLDLDFPSPPRRIDIPVIAPPELWRQRRMEPGLSSDHASSEGTTGTRPVKPGEVRLAVVGHAGLRCRPGQAVLRVSRVEV